MSATSTGLMTLPRRGVFTALRNAVSRDEFFAGLYILGCVNGLLGRAIQSFSFDSWAGAISGIDMNVVVLFACFAGISAMLSESRDRDEIRSTDVAVAVVFLMFVSLPIFPLSWMAVTGLSFYILLFANGRSERTRGAIILLALTVPMLWSRLLFQLFAKFILDIDATLVGSLLGTDRVRQYGGFCRSFRILDRVAGVFLIGQHVSGLFMLGQYNAMGQAPVVSYGYRVVAACVPVGDRGECHTNQPHGCEPQPLCRDPQRSGRLGGQFDHAGSDGRF